MRKTFWEDAQLRARNKSCADENIITRECAKRTFVHKVVARSAILLYIVGVGRDGYAGGGETGKD